MVWTVQFTAVLLSVNLLAASNGSQLVGELHRRGAYKALSYMCQGLLVWNRQHLCACFISIRRCIGLMGTCLAANRIFSHQQDLQRIKVLTAFYEDMPSGPLSCAALCCAGLTSAFATAVMSVNGVPVGAPSGSGGWQPWAPATPAPEASLAAPTPQTGGQNHRVQWFILAAGAPLWLN